MSHAVRYLQRELEDQKAKLEAVEVQEADAIQDGIDAQKRVDAQEQVVTDLQVALARLENAGLDAVAGMMGLQGD
jgi:hypothetical protein